MKFIFKTVAVISILFLYGLLSGCSKIPTEADLEISPYDEIPDVSSHILFPQGIQGGDSIVVCFKPSAELGNLEFAYRIALTDYAGTTIYSAFDDNRDTLVIRGLSDNIRTQKWELSIIGRYPGNAGYADTLDYYFTIEDDTQSVQLSPSYILINPLIDSSFYIDINLDDIADSILAGELSLHFDNNLVVCDTIVYPVTDSLYYFLSGDGDFISFSDFNASSDSITFNFAFANGEVDGLPGSGKVIRVYFIAKKPGTCKVSLEQGRLKDINNNTVAVELTSVSIPISYMEN